MEISICGIDCSVCEHKVNNNCGGCRVNKGEVFWGNCELFSCAAEKQLMHCGFCEDFPCNKLREGLEAEGSDGIEVLRNLMKKQTIVQSRCGLMCGNCEFREPYSCGGCIETNGHPFHGECPVAVCCQNKSFTHCGECPDVPCEILHEYSCSEGEHSDVPAGARISVVKCWNKLNNTK